MFETRQLPDPGMPAPHRLHSPRAALFTHARLLGQPLIVSCHWHVRQRRSVPHLIVGCPLCEELGSLETYGQAYAPAVIQQRAMLDARESTDSTWLAVVLMLPEHLAGDVSRHQQGGREWRGLALDLWHPSHKANAPLACRVLGRQDATTWPDGWDVRADLEHAWRDYLALARTLSAADEPQEREPGEEG
jgi:hypothetical protein